LCLESLEIPILYINGWESIERPAGGNGLSEVVGRKGKKRGFGL
jgi:hypothetical protein